MTSTGLASALSYQYQLTGFAGQSLVRMDPWARQVSGATGTAIVYDESAFEWTTGGYQTPFWDDLVIYEIHVGSFDQRPGQVAGTLDEVTAKLPYLADLGISAVELLPLSQFPEQNSWGYDPSDPFAVDEELGGPDVFKAFVQAAHDSGVAVILDVVYNHMGTQDNALWQFDGWQQGGLGGIYFYEDYRHSTPWGERPDYGRTEVRNYLCENAVDWLAQYRTDGLRLDATSYIRRTAGNYPGTTDIPDGSLLLTEITGAVAANQPWKLVIAEDMSDYAAVTQPTVEGGLGFNSKWAPDFPAQIRGPSRPSTTVSEAW